MLPTHLPIHPGHPFRKLQDEGEGKSQDPTGQLHPNLHRDWGSQSTGQKGVLTSSTKWKLSKFIIFSFFLF